MRTGDESAELYREKAAVLRLLARRAHGPEVRAGLIVLAESFEMLAERVEVWRREPQATD